MTEYAKLDRKRSVKVRKATSSLPLRLESGARSSNTSSISLKHSYLGAIVDDENPPRRRTTRRNRSWLRSLVTSLSAHLSLLAPSYDLILPRTPPCFLCVLQATWCAIVVCIIRAQQRLLAQLGPGIYGDRRPL